MACHATEGGTDGGVEGLYITDIPEPATMTLLAVGGLALLRRKRNARR